MKNKNIVECPYWIVNSKQEQELVEQKTGRKWDDVGLSFPYMIGFEQLFNFQNQNVNEIMEDFNDKKTNKTFTYIKQTI